ncbi:MAG: hypothetical protein JST00_20730 [Deltaproteobacteria bacterium]|nr:hypothetical protein [Deltaproteobacteria bacterium]
MDPAQNGANRQTSEVILRPALDPRLVEPVFMVWVEGSDPVGPVSADQIARGMRAGKVPSDAQIKRTADVFWGDLLDEELVVAALKAVSEESEVPPPPSVLEGLQAAEFLVWVEGSEPVGPVSAHQIARGIRAGKVPPDASVQRVGDLFSCDVLDEPQVILALKQL